MTDTSLKVTVTGSLQQIRGREPQIESGDEEGMIPSDGHTDSSSQEFDSAKEIFKPVHQARQQRPPSHTSTIRHEHKKGAMSAAKGKKKKAKPMPACPVPTRSHPQAAKSAKPRVQASKARVTHESPTDASVISSASDQVAMECGCGDARVESRMLITCTGCNRGKHAECMG